MSKRRNGGKNGNLKWDFQMRLFLYRALVVRFGPYERWPNGQPSDKNQYLRCLNEIGTYFASQQGLLDAHDRGPAVGQQVSWAITTQPEVGPTHVAQFINNKAAAYDAGFITASNLPSTVLSEYR